MKNGENLTWELQNRLNDFFEDERQIELLLNNKVVLVDAEFVQLIMQLQKFFSVFDRRNFSIAETSCNFKSNKTDPEDFIYSCNTKFMQQSVCLDKLQIVSVMEEREQFIDSLNWRTRCFIKKSVKNWLGVNHFLWFWNNKDKIPEKWKHLRSGHIKHIYFDGSILEDPISNCTYVLYLYWLNNKWNWSVSPINSNRSKNCVSVLEYL